MLFPLFFVPHNKICILFLRVNAQTHFLGQYQIFPLIFVKFAIY